MTGHIYVHVLRAFADENGNFGDGAGIIIDEKRQLDDARRLTLTQGLGWAESVFVNDLQSCNVSIFNPQNEIKFSGPAVAGTAWLLMKLRGESAVTIRSLGGDTKAWQGGELTRLRADLDMMPPWHLKQLDTPESIMRFSSNEGAAMEHTMIWAWINEAKGVVRARTYAGDWDILEPEANGSGAMVLAAKLKRSIEVVHGKGSIIYAKPVGRNMVELAGRIVEDRPVEF
jgi:predicted PhzF superfamily epimerase YddE/YHI9